MLLSLLPMFYFTVEVRIDKSVVPIMNAYDKVTASGVLINPRTMLTVAHAVGPVGSIVFTQCGDDALAGQVTRKATGHDLALVTLFQRCLNVKIADLASDEPLDGDDVTIEGYPNRALTHTPAKVVAYRFYPVVNPQFGSPLLWIGMTLGGEVRAGSSGGPVFTKGGKLCGVIHGYSETMIGKPGVAVPLRAIVSFLSEAAIGM